jgi:hypothetical protein
MLYAMTLISFLKKNAVRHIKVFFQSNFGHHTFSVMKCSTAKFLRDKLSQRAKKMLWKAVIV